MRKIEFLDCTLRDGGYINDWRFGNLTIHSIVARLDAAGIDYIEVGFLDSRKEYDNERSIYPDIPSISKTLGCFHPKKAKLVAMIDFGTFDESLLVPAAESCLYGIRLIFTKDKAEKALEYARKIKEQGYHLFINLVSTSSYDCQELTSLGEAINNIEPTAVSIVDTYGLMFGTDMITYSKILDKVLLPQIILGYHSHNNMQMSNANSMEFIRLNMERDVVVDSSLLGMGKNAGNACTEILLSFANSGKLRHFDISQVLECAYIDVEKFQNKVNWGYRLEFLISAIMRCSPNWTKYYMKEKTLSIKDICEILSNLPDDKKYLPSFFTEQLAEQLLSDYINKNVNDAESKNNLSLDICGKPVLLICPGSTLSKYNEAIKEYISQKSPIIISVNFVPTEFIPNYIWISNSVRYSQLTSLYMQHNMSPNILLTSNITPLPTFAGKYIFNFKMLRDRIGGEVSVVLLLELLLSLNVKEIAFAGFDGFSETNKNYFDSGYSLFYDEHSNSRISEQLKRVLGNYKNKNISFVTPSMFESVLRED